jgi:hypothetical protein
MAVWRLPAKPGTILFGGANARILHQGMIEAVFEKRVIEVYGGSAAHTCETIATAMGATGEI